VFVIVPQAAGVKVAEVLANVIPDGNVSGVCTFVTAPGFDAGLLIANISCAVPPTAIAGGDSVFVTVGAV
jgi:hypothetical protein